MAPSPPLALPSLPASFPGVTEPELPLLPHATGRAAATTDARATRNPVTRWQRARMGSGLHDPAHPETISRGWLRPRQLFVKPSCSWRPALPPPGRSADEPRPERTVRPPLAPVGARGTRERDADAADGPAHRADP